MLPYAYVVNYPKLKEYFPCGNLHVCYSEILLRMDRMVQSAGGFIPNALAIPYRKNCYAMFDLVEQQDNRLYYTFTDITL